MSKRGRKSSAELSTVVSADFTSKRPKPPAEFTDSQAQIWRDVVASEPADFFVTSALQGILANYCLHKDSAEQISQIISAFKPEWLRAEEGAKRYDGLLRMRERETRAMLSCATKLRLTNQARYTPQAAGTAARNMGRVEKPWE